MALAERHIKAMMDTYSKFGLSEEQLNQLKSILRSGKVGVAETNDLITDAARSKLSMGYSFVPSDLDSDLAGSRKNLLDFIQRNSQATPTPTPTPTPNKPGKITAQQFLEGKKANVPTTPATPNVVTRPVQPNLPAYGPMQQSSYPKIEITPATQSTSPHNAKIRGVQLDQPQPMQGPRPATQLGPQRAPIQGPRMSTPPINGATQSANPLFRKAGELFGGLRSSISKIGQIPVGKGLTLGGATTGTLNTLGRIDAAGRVLNPELSDRDRGIAATGVINPLLGLAVGGMSALDDVMANLTGVSSDNAYVSGRGEGYTYFDPANTRERIKEGKIEVTGADGVPVKLDMNNPSDVQKLQAVQGKKPNFIEVTGADGKPTLLDMNNPADVERLQQIEPKGSGSAPLAPPANPPVDPRGPSAKDLFDKHFAATNDEDQARKLAKSEGMRIWAQKYGGKDGLASKVKPGQAGFEDIQIAQGRMPSLVGQVAPQAFADNAIKNFSDSLKMDTVMPEGTILGVADDLDEAYAKVSDPAFTEAIQNAFASGVNFATGARASKPPATESKPSAQSTDSRPITVDNANIPPGGTPEFDQYLKDLQAGKLTRPNPYARK